MRFYHLIFCLIVVFSFSIKPVIAFKRIDSSLLNQTTSHVLVDSQLLQNINAVKIGLSKADIKEMNSSEKLFFRLLRNPKGVSDTIINNDSILRINSYHLLKRGDIYAFHPYWVNKKKCSYNFSVISTFAYYGYSLNGSTGGYSSLNGWDTVSVVSKAIKAGCRLDLCVYHKNTGKYSDNLTDFLNNSTAQNNFAETLCEQLKYRGASGVNIMFEEMDSTHRDNFTAFINLLSNTLKINKYRLTVTIPALDNMHIYDITNLNSYVDQFVIDFTKKREYGSIAPLNGKDYSIESNLIRTLKMGVKSTKFIACLPLYGALWNYNTKEFSRYVPYNEIEDEFLIRSDSVHYMNEVYLDLINNYGDTLQLFYDDAQTLDKKYDYVLKNRLGGVGLWVLSYDNYTQDLTNVLLRNLLFVDTCEIVNLKTAPSTLSKIYTDVNHEFSLYKELFQHPCEFGKEKRKDMVSDDYVGYLTLVLLVILIVLTLFYILQTRNLGDNWIHRKLILGILITLVVLTMSSALMFCFLSPYISSFGITLVNVNCETSFITILQVLGVGFLIGTLAMKFLILPLLKSKEIP